jgi:hypothetical protein
MSYDPRPALERVCKWRMILAGWHLGTAPKTAPGVQAMRDLREVVMLMRMELNALTKVLIDHKLFGLPEFQFALKAEAEQTEIDMAERFPGMRAIDEGISIYDPPLAAETMRRLGFPK